MEELASFIGWVVIIVGGLFGLSHLIISLNEPKRLEGERLIRENEERHFISSLIHIISLNRIYWNCRTDKEIEVVKYFADKNLGGWYVLKDSEKALLDVYNEIGARDKFELASKVIEDHGEPLIFENGSISVKTNRGELGKYY